MNRKPIFLLADSELLFARDGDRTFTDRIRAALEVAPCDAKAAYVGASNGDVPGFFELFEAAMEEIGVHACTHVRADVEPVATASIEGADLVLLAGGDVAVGWSAFQRTGLVDALHAFCQRGGILVGVSAGAVQMGVLGRGASGERLGLLALLPYAIDVHAEPAWESLASRVEEGAGLIAGLGIPRGAGAIAYPDGTIEPVRKPLTQVVLRSGHVHMTDVLAAPLGAEESATVVGRVPGRSLRSGR